VSHAILQTKMFSAKDLKDFVTNGSHYRCSTYQFDSVKNEDTGQEQFYRDEIKVSVRKFI